jgi:pimeloyl-ACP methyl ester carboxylesterase
MNLRYIWFMPLHSRRDNSINSRNASVDGVSLHYLSAGQGTPVVLLHGYTQTSLMWTPVIPQLAERFTVIAPDLPGIGDSGIPSEGLDLGTAAVRIHSLVKSLGFAKALVVGHDIGLMVAYAYAAQFPSEVEKLVLMDAFLPGIEGWESTFNSPALWHFRFHGPTPEKLVEGREQLYFDYYWNDFAADKTHSIPENFRKAFVASYSRPGRMQAGWAYFDSFPGTGEKFKKYAETKLMIPVLTISGEKSAGSLLGDQARIVANDVTAIILKNAGHWVMEEQPAETMQALLKFL